MRSSYRLVGLLIGILFAGSAQARLVGLPDIPGLVDQSDLIVVGRTLSTTIEFVSSPDREGAIETTHISVRRFLKGSLDEKTHYVTVQRFSPRYEADQPLSFQDGRYGIFFLKQGENGAYAAADPDHFPVVASPTYQPAPAEPGDLETQIARELVAVIATPPIALIDRFSGVNDPWAVVAPGSDDPLSAADGIYNHASEAIETLPQTTTRPLLEPIVGSPHELSSLWAIICLTSQGETRYLPGVEDLLLNQPSQFKRTLGYLALVMGSKYDNFTPDDIPFLSNLLTSSDVTVRHAAASALAHLKTDAVIVPLASMAMKDEDRHVRMQAFMGLCNVAGMNAPPCHARFDETAHLAYWTQWAASKGIK
jgi:hypothetical protein